MPGFESLTSIQKVTTPIPYKVLYRSKYKKECIDLFYQIVAFIQNIIFYEKPIHPTSTDQTMFHVLEESFPYCYIYKLRYIPANYSDGEVKADASGNIESFQHHLNVSLYCGEDMVQIWEHTNPCSRKSLFCETLHKLHFTQRISSQQFFLDTLIKTDKDMKLMKANFFPLLGVWLKTPKDHIPAPLFTKLMDNNVRAYAKAKTMKEKFAFFKLSLNKHLLVQQSKAASQSKTSTVHEIFLNELIVHMIEEAGKFQF